MKFCSLASGSSGNCFYVENKNSGILIDAGISAKRIVERLESINKKPENVKAIFITHEHSDHTRGADVFSRTFNVPIFATKKTADSFLLCSDEDKINIIKNNEINNIFSMEIRAFSKQHKAEDPISFAIKGDKIMSIITDAGVCCENIIDAVANSNFLCIEANHDIEMLEKGPYPWYLKNWIKSDIGHLSNSQAGLCVLEYAKPKLKNIMLSHLSQTNNNPGLALEVFHSLLKERRDLKPKVYVSVREKASEFLKV